MIDYGDPVPDASSLDDIMENPDSREAVTFGTKSHIRSHDLVPRSPLSRISPCHAAIKSDCRSMPTVRLIEVLNFYGPEKVRPLGEE